MVVTPTDTPLTTPEELMVPTDVVLLVHVPPLVAFAKVVWPAIHIESVPVIGLGVGNGVMVTTEVAIFEPHVFEMV